MKKHIIIVVPMALLFIAVISYWGSSLLFFANYASNDGLEFEEFKSSVHDEIFWETASREVGLIQRAMERSKIVTITYRVEIDKRTLVLQPQDFVSPPLIDMRNGQKRHLIVCNRDMLYCLATSEIVAEAHAGSKTVAVTGAIIEWTEQNRYGVKQLAACDIENASKWNYVGLGHLRFTGLPRSEIMGVEYQVDGIEKEDLAYVGKATGLAGLRRIALAAEAKKAKALKGAEEVKIG